MFVATSKPWQAAERIVEHFEMGQYFEKVYGCELDGTRSGKVEELRAAGAVSIAARPADLPALIL